MIDLRERSRDIEQIAPPDLWAEIARRVATEAEDAVVADVTPPRRLSQGLRRVLTIAAAFALMAGALVLAMRAFEHVERPTPAVPSDVEWIHPVPTQGHDGRSPIAADESSVYVLTDTTERSAGYDVRLTRYDHAGNEIWSTVFGTPRIDDGDAVAVSSDAVYVVTGTHGHGHFLLLRFDKSGQELWRHVIEHAGRWVDVSFASNVYVLVGGADAPHDALLVKYNVDGNELWHRDVPGIGGSVSADATGAYVTARRPDSQHRGTGDATVLKFDPDGNQQWTAVGEAGDEFIDVVATSDGAYTIGSSESNGDAFVRLYGMEGAERWTHAVAGDGFGINTGGGITADATGVYVATVSSAGRMNAAWQGQPVVRAWDPTGAELWTIAGDVEQDVEEASIDLAVWDGAAYVSWEEGGHVVAANLFPRVARWNGYIEQLERPFA